MRQKLLPIATFTASALLLLGACRPIQPALPASAGAAPVVEAADAGDGLTISVENGVTTLDLFSTRGIGTAQVRFPPTSAPQQVVLRFHLQGLEQAILDNGAQQLEISVASHDPYVVSQTLLTEAGAQPLREGDERWAHVELIATDDGTPTIPLRAGYIAVTLPPGFIDAAHPRLTLRWIDFYR